jgi:hypothetical protein
MRYRIDFSAAEHGSVALLLRRLVARSSRMVERDGVFIIDGTAMVRPTADGESAVDVSSANTAALYHLLSLYFDEAGAREEGALVTLLEGSSLNIIAITNEKDAGFGPTPLGFVVSAEEILKDQSVFASAWPELTRQTDAYEEFAENDEIVTTSNSEADMIFLPYLAGPDDDTQTVSFLIFGASPKIVMEQLVRVPDYAVHDPDFLSFDMETAGGALEAVSFGTSEGPAVELRLPLPQARIADAIESLARSNASGPQLIINYVTDIIDAEEQFIIQFIAEDGTLDAPRKVRLN